MIHLAALLITLLTESLGIVLFLTWRQESPWRGWGGLLIVNLITHTLFWFSFPQIALPFLLKLYLYELLIAGVEGSFYRFWLGWSWRQALTVGFVLNLISYAAGLLLWQFWFR